MAAFRENRLRAGAHGALDFSGGGSMRRGCEWIGIACLGVALFAGTGGTRLWATPQAAGAAPGYTLPEYNAYQAAHAETNPANKVKLLDDFVAKYPMSQLLKFVYGDYYLAYMAQKNYPKTFEYVDKELGLGETIDANARLTALVARSQAFLAGQADKSMQTPEVLTKARDAATDGLKALAAYQKPDKVTDEAFATQKKTIGLMLNSAGGTASNGLKDYKGAIGFYKATLALEPNDAVTHYRMATAYLQDKPPATLDGAWELARAIDLKVQNDAQVRAYLRNQVLNYQQVSCDKLVDDEINNLLTLAMTATERPASFTLPSADDLQKARDDTNNLIPWLQEGGEHGKVMWLATCGLEYPDVAVKVLEADPGDGENVTLKVYRPLAADPDAAGKEMEAASAPNMEVHVTGQPDAKKLMKDDQVRFTGTLSAYTQSPFLLTWDMAKVNADDLKDAEAPAGTPKKATPARPGAARPAAPKKLP
jgi:hypothetical protein